MAFQLPERILYTGVVLLGATPAFFIYFRHNTQDTAHLPVLQVLNLLLRRCWIVKRFKGQKAGYKKDASEKEHVFLLRSDSIVEQGWDCGCRLYYTQNNEMML